MRMERLKVKKEIEKNSIIQKEIIEKINETKEKEQGNLVKPDVISIDDFINHKSLIIKKNLNMLVAQEDL